MTHYYGGYVRRLFLAGGAIMLASLPFLQAFIPYSTFESILAGLVIVLCAGLIAPYQKWIVMLNALVAAAAVLIFEYYAVTSYGQGLASFFAVNQILAVIFLIAFYFAVKTVRGILEQK